MNHTGIRMGSRGQGFDVFKLLIAAVVAGAILLILLQTLQILPDIGSTNPNNAATNSVKSKINELGLPQLIENVSFKNGDSLNAATIAEGSRALSKEQVCLLVSPNAPGQGGTGTGPFISSASNQVVRYDGSFEQKVRLLVLCDRGQDIDTTLTDYEYDTDFELDVDDCGFSDSVQRVCLVAIIP